jgi:hypothetical protein
VKHWNGGFTPIDSEAGMRRFENNFKRDGDTGFVFTSTKEGLMYNNNWKTWISNYSEYTSYDARKIKKLKELQKL